MLEWLAVRRACGPHSGLGEGLVTKVLSRSIILLASPDWNRQLCKNTVFITFSGICVLVSSLKLDKQFVSYSQCLSEHQCKLMKQTWIKYLCTFWKSTAHLLLHSTLAKTTVSLLPCHAIWKYNMTVIILCIPLWNNQIISTPFWTIITAASQTKSGKMIFEKIFLHQRN